MNCSHRGLARAGTVCDSSSSVRDGHVAKLLDLLGRVAGEGYSAAIRDSCRLIIDRLSHYEVCATLFVVEKARMTASRPIQQCLAMPKGAKQSVVKSLDRSISFDPTIVWNNKLYLPSRGVLGGGSCSLDWV